MSMNCYAIDVFGLILTENEITDFEKAVNNKLTKDEKYDYDDVNIYDIIDDEENELTKIEHNMEYITDVENANIYNLKNDTVYLADTLLAFHTKRFLKCVGAAYETEDALISEFKNDLSEYLPDDFDWTTHIGIVRGVVLQ